MQYDKIGHKKIFSFSFFLDRGLLRFAVLSNALAYWGGPTTSPSVDVYALAFSQPFFNASIY